MTTPSQTGAADAALRAAVGRWFYSNDPAWIRKLLDLRRTLPEEYQVFASSLRAVLDGQDLNCEDVLSKLQENGQTDAEKQLQGYVDVARTSVTESTFTGSLDVLLRLFTAKNLVNLGQDVVSGAIGSLADLFTQIDALRVVEAATAHAAALTTVNRLRDLNVERPETAVGDLIFKKSFAILGGDPKAGKTTLSLQMALGVVTGKPVMGLEIGVRGPVVLIQADMGESYFGYVLKQLARGMDIDIEEDLPFPIHFLCATTVDLGDNETRGRLKAEIVKHAPALIVLDPLRYLHAGDENKPEELKPVLDFALELRDETGGIVILVDHLVKPQPGAGRTGPRGYALRGSGAKYGRGDSVLIVRDMGDGISSVSATHRYGAPVDEFHFRLASEPEIPAGICLVECEAPAGEDEDGADPPALRVQRFLQDHPGWHSKRKIAEGATCRPEYVSRALVALFGRDLVAHDEKPANRRRWMWSPKDENPSYASHASHASGNQGITCLGSASHASPLKGEGSMGIMNSPRDDRPPEACREPGEEG